MQNKLSNQIKEHLSEKEFHQLSEIVKIPDMELRHQSLRSFFHSPLIFDKIKPIYDPTWLSYDIFINGKQYEY